MLPLGAFVKRGQNRPSEPKKDSELVPPREGQVLSPANDIVAAVLQAVLRKIAVRRVGIVPEHATYSASSSADCGPGDCTCTNVAAGDQRASRPGRCVDCSAFGTVPEDLVARSWQA